MIGGFTFKIAKPKEHKETVKKVSNKLVQGVCFLDETDNIWKIHIPMSEDSENNDAMRVLEFTKDSYELKGKLYVFTKNKKERGKPICIVRTKEKALACPGLESMYTPFCKNWVYSGYIVKENGKTMFQMHEAVGIDGLEKVSYVMR